MNWTPAHTDALRTVAVRMRKLGNTPADVEDCMQSAALYLWERQVGSENVAALRRRAQCAAIDAIRADLATRGWTRRGTWRPIPAASAETAPAADADMEAADLMRAIDALPHPLPLVAHMVLLGYRQGEIAACTGVTAAATHYRVERIRQALTREPK